MSDFDEVNSNQHMMGSETDYSHHKEKVIGASKSVPDFSGKITGRNSPENNWEDQRSVDNWSRNSFDIDSASYNKDVK